MPPPDEAPYSEKPRPAPDGAHVARLRFAGEIRFGPPYFALELDGVPFGHRRFGATSLWSPDSRYLALEEWLSTSEREGPRTQLLLLDVTSGRECVVAQALGGFITPLRFEAGRLVYRKEYLDRGVAAAFDQPLPDADRWRPFHMRELTP